MLNIPKLATRDNSNNNERKLRCHTNANRKPASKSVESQMSERGPILGAEPWPPIPFYIAKAIGDKHLRDDSPELVKNDGDELKEQNKNDDKHVKMIYRNDNNHQVYYKSLVNS